jgi:hypothetical protein
MENTSKDVIENADRREVMAAILKYSAVVAGASTVVMSSADAVSASAASRGGPRGGPQGNNGLGNGDQPPPGGSCENNNAENAGCSDDNPNPDGGGPPGLGKKNK